MGDMTFARRCADLFARGSGVYHGAIYEDGFLLYLAVCEDTARLWAESLGATQYACSEDGMVWAFVMRGDPEVLLALATIVGEAIHSDWEGLATLQDNRQLDDCTIDRFRSRLHRRGDR